VALFGKISIKHKLTSIAVLPSTLVLLTAVLIFFIIDEAAHKKAMVQEGTMLARVIGANNSAALLFGDQKSAVENLSVLSLNDHVISGTIFTSDNTVFASYSRPANNSLPEMPLLKGDGHLFDDKTLSICSNIVSNSTVIGTVYLLYDLDSLYSRRTGYITTAAVIVALFTILVLLLSRWAKKTISDPVLSLTETARKITHDNDYSVRGRFDGHGEFGELVHCFNEMLNQIQQRDVLLERHSDELENQVSRRTAELKTSNNNLRLQIAENARIEEELFRTRQLESLGVLAGGIAHDFNNLLAAILMNTSLAKKHTTADSKAFARLEGVEKACLRAKDLTQQLLTFSKGGAPITKVTSIAELIVDSARFVFRGSKSLCSFDIAEDIWPVSVDEGQISQVIHNLAINADQAMQDGGNVLIRMENFVVKSDSRLSLKPGNYVRISVKDNGIGIPKDVLAKIFTPYFTTKDTGSGLGLATSYSIINKHNGLITVESEPGSGTTFRIYLPASKEKPYQAETLLENEITGTGRILIMDDDEFVQKVTGDALIHYGFQVGYVHCGAEAIDAYLEAINAGEAYDLIIMDLTIPGKMGGEETIKKLLAVDPYAKAVAVSGYAHGSIMSDFRTYGFKGVLAKPFSLNDLCQLVDRVIHNG
jgi:signal transduction histidine kinase/ActR/RegA family two-component response regulator